MIKSIYDFNVMGINFNINLKHYTNSNRRLNRQIRQIEKWTNRRIDKKVDRRTNRQENRQIDSK